MSIRLPLQTVLSATNNDEVGAGSVGGFIVAGTVMLPQDTDNITLKLTASVVGGGVSAMLQTTDDGGTTWFGLGRTSVVSNAVGDNVQWLSVSTDGAGVSTGSVIATGSVQGGFSIGSAQASVLAPRYMSGLPVLSQQSRVILQLVGNVTSSSILTQIKVNSQSGTA